MIFSKLSNVHVPLDGLTPTFYISQALDQRSQRYSMLVCLTICTH